MDKKEIRILVKTEMIATAYDIEYLTWFEEWVMSEEEAEYAQSLVDNAKVRIILPEGM